LTPTVGNQYSATVSFTDGGLRAGVRLQRYSCVSVCNQYSATVSFTDGGLRAGVRLQRYSCVSVCNQYNATVCTCSVFMPDFVFDELCIFTLCF